MGLRELDCVGGGGFDKGSIYTNNKGKLMQCLVYSPPVAVPHKEYKTDKNIRGLF